MAMAREVYEGDEDIRVECRVGYQSDQADPLERLKQFSNHGGWSPTPDLSVTLSMVLDARRSGRILYPHDEYDTQRVQAGFEALFQEGVAFANFSDETSGSNWSRSSFPFEGPQDDWETSSSLAVGATLGPLVGFLAVNVRDSL